MPGALLINCDIQTNTRIRTHTLLFCASPSTDLTNKVSCNFHKDVLTVDYLDIPEISEVDLHIT